MTGSDEDAAAALNRNRRMRDQQQSGPPGPPGSRRRLNPRPSNSTVAGTSNATPNDASNGRPSHGETINDTTTNDTSDQRSSHGGTSNAATDNTADRRTPMNHFLNPSQTDIRSSLHATALEGILQLAAAHPDGILGSLGHGKRISWFETNTANFFRAPDGILSHWQSVVPNVLRRKFGQAQTLAKEILDRDHSNDQDGSAAGDVPEWVKLFRFFFDQQQNQRMRNSQSIRALNERPQIAASLAGRLAPLGATGERPEILRTETSGNEEDPRMRRQIIGNVNAEILDSDPLMEGLDDVENRTAAPMENTTNGARRMNVHTSSGFGANSNDPSTWFQSIVRICECMDNLSNAIVRSLESPYPSQPRTLTEIGNDFERTSQRLANATTERETTFYNRMLSRLEREMDDYDA